MLKESRLCLTEESDGGDGGNSWWRRRSRLEKKFCVLTLVLMSVMFGLTASFVWLCLVYKQVIPGISGVPSATSPTTTSAIGSVTEPYDPEYTTEQEMPQEVCMTSSCIHAASEILQNMDPTKDPCEDFYSYACGGFEEKNFIDDDKSKTGYFSKVGKLLDFQLKEILEEDISPNDTKSIVLAKDFYASCTNKTQAEKDGLKPVDDILDLIGGWPVLEGHRWDDVGFSWQKLMYKFTKANLPNSFFIEIAIERDYQTGSSNILHLEEPGLPLPRDYLLNGKNDSLVQIHLKYMIETAKFFGANETIATKEMEDVLDFEMKLAYLLPEDEDEENLTEIYKKMTVADLQQINPNVSWQDYISNIIPYKIDGKEPIVLTSLNYTKNFTKLLAETDPRVLTNYAVGSIVRYLTPYISDEFGQMRFDLMKDMIGVAQRTARWRRCLGQTSGKFDIAISQLYVKKFFKPYAKLKALEMVKYITDEMDDIISNVTWADPLTKQRARDKLAAVHPHIGYPEELLSNAKVDAEYENLTAMDRDNYFANIRNYRIFTENRYYAKLRKPVEKNSWKRAADVAVVNAYYSMLDNSIILPAGILQDIFFNPDRPQYMNFAAIGTVVGHELTHGFDTNGRQFDKNGHLKNWWEEETDKQFTNRSQCMVKQYSEYISPNTGQNLDGKQTLAENIADNGGIKESYLAYQRWSKVRGIVELPLPGFNMTTNQLFWLSYANLWCTKQRLSAEKLHIALGGHTISRYRVNGPLSNMQPFAEDFKCEKGQPLNPEQRCSIW